MPASAPKCTCTAAQLPACTALHCPGPDRTALLRMHRHLRQPLLPGCVLTTDLLQGRTGLQPGALVPAAWATVTVSTPLEAPTGAAPLAASLGQLKPSKDQTLQATLARAVLAGAEAEQKAELPSACSLPQGFRIVAVQPIQPRTSATPSAATDGLSAEAAAPALPKCPQPQQAGSTAKHVLRACARLLTGQRRQEPPTPEQKLQEQVLAIVQAAAASQPIPAEQHSKTLVQAAAAWYVANILQEPRALIKDG